MYFLVAKVFARIDVHYLPYFRRELAITMELSNSLSSYAVADWNGGREVPPFNNKMCVFHSGCYHCPDRCPSTSADWMWIDSALKELISSDEGALCPDRKNRVICGG